MDEHIYTVEELMLDDSFKSFCLGTNGESSSHWVTIIKDHPEQSLVFKEAKELVLALNAGLTQSDVHRQIELVRRALKEKSENQSSSKPEYIPSISDNYVVTNSGKVKRLTRVKIIRYSAAACILAIIGSLFFYLNGQRTNPSQLAVTEIQSTFGNRKNITLPDGSEVLLNSNSKVSYKSNFNQKLREITLTGSAFFKVAKDASRPFLVSSNGITTMALGTQFIVENNLNEQNSTSVELLEGKVKVSSEKNPESNNVILTPGEKAQTIDGIHLTKALFDSTSARSWVDGIIEFKDTPASDALKELEQWYHVKIEADQKRLNKYSINGVYRNASLEDVLKVICFTINKKYDAQGDTIYIK